jgi:hypothetical protein
MDNYPDYEYEYGTVPVDSRPRQQAKELKKLAKKGWQVLSVRPGTMFSGLSITSDAHLRRVRSRSKPAQSQGKLPDHSRELPTQQRDPLPRN